MFLKHSLPILWIVIGASAIGCSSKRALYITSNPPGAFVKADQTNLGKTPLNYVYDAATMPTFTITAQKDGYFPVSKVFKYPSSPPQFDFVLRENPIWKETATSDATNRWLRIQINQTISPESAWQKIVDSITNQYDILENMDQTSGYVRSTTRVRRWDIGDSRGAFNLRNQFLCSISSSDPLTYKFKIKSEFRWGDRGNNWQPYERILRSDAELVEELTNRMGIK